MKTDLQILFLFNLTDQDQKYINDNHMSSKLKIHFSSDGEEQLKLAPIIDILVGRRVSLEVLEAAVNLKHYIFPGTGVDGLLATFSNYSRRNEVILSNTHRSSYNCAQQAVALLLTLMNQISIHDNRMRNQETPSREPTSVLLQNIRLLSL